MNKRAVVALAVVLVAMVAACGKTQPPVGEMPAGTTPGSRPSAMDTLAEKPTVSVTKPATARDIPIGDLPDEMRLEGGRIGIDEEENKCVDTVVYEWLNGPDASADETLRVTALGTAITTCVDQARLAKLIANQVRVTMPTLNVDQVDCVETEIVNSDPAALAVFLGAYTYDGSGVPALQVPFITSFTTACKITI